MPINGMPQPGEPTQSLPGFIGAATPQGADQTMAMGDQPPSWQKKVALPYGEDEPKPEPEELEEVKPVLEVEPLVGMVKKEFSDYRAARIPTEMGIWVKAFMNNKGVYLGDTDLNGGTSVAFVQITGPKIRTALAMMMQIITPPGDHAWSVEPPMEPAYIDKAYELLEAGNDPQSIRDMLRTECEKSCENLEHKMIGGLEADNFDTKLLRVAWDAIMFGTGFVEGPMAVDNYPELGDEPLEDDRSLVRKLIDKAKEAVGLGDKKQKLKKLIKAGVIDRVRPELKTYSPFEVYVDPGARCVEDARSVVIRMVVNRQQIREWRDQKGFDADAINQVLNDAGDGNWKGESWETILATGNAQFQQNMPNGRFVVLKRWGMLSGRTLRDAGLTVPDDQLEDQVMAQIWVCGDKVIRLSVSDELHCKRIPVYMVRYSISPQSPYGVGIPEMMFDSQDAVNACERAKMDNMAFICRPQVVVRSALLDLADPTEAIEMQPGKIWKYRESQLPMNGMKPVEFWVPDNALDAISKVQQEAMVLAEEQTALPRFLMGQNSEGTHNRTLGGATLQFDRAITPFKTAVFNFENDLFVPMLRKYGEFYQLFSNDPSIKGEFRVTAKGVQGLMAREILAQRIGEAFAAFSQNPQMGERASEVIDPSKLFDKFLQGTGLDSEDLFYTQKEIDRRKADDEAKKAQEAQQQLAVAMAPKMRAETPPKDAMLGLLKAAPEDSQTRMVLIDQVAQAFGFLTPQLDEAIKHDATAMGIQDVTSAHAAGHAMAGLDTTMPEPGHIPQPLGQPGTPPAQS